VTRSLFDRGNGPVPLPYRMRPASLDDLVGQETLLGQNGLFRRFLSEGRWPSMVLFGPPGTGKSGFVELLPRLLPDHSFAQINATTSGVPDLRKELLRGEARRREGGSHLVVVDEIHTWSKSQQEVLLSGVETGQIILLGLSNETPYAALIPPLASRLLLFPFHPLEEGALSVLLDRGLERLAKEEKKMPVSLDPAARSLLLRYAGGDGRRLLLALESVVLIAARRGGDARLVNEEDVLSVLSRAGQVYGDKDSHYDIISAFIKSVRNYDPDAALHWLARMLEGGEDPLYIARRLVILAAEDVGLADPQALTQAVACFQAVSQVGLPEGRIPLAMTTVFLSLSPKSISAYKALDLALSDVRGGFSPPVPLPLRDRTSKRAFARDVAPSALDYLYPPDQPEGVSPQEHLPGGQGRRYYYPSDRGRERELRERFEATRKIRESSPVMPPPPAGA